LAKFTFARFTVTIASPGVFTSVAHGMTTNDTVIFNSSGALATGLSANTTYYVIATGLTDDVFQVSATLGGSAVDTSVAQSGVHTFLQTNVEPGIPAIHHIYLARVASLTRLIDKSEAQSQTLFQLIQRDEERIKEFFSQRSKDIENRLNILVEDNH